MVSVPTTKSARRARRWALVVAIIVVGLNLRGPIAAVSPVLADLQRELGISAAAAGFLTSVPVLCFAAVSPLVVLLARRIGVDAAIAVSLVMLSLGVALRPWSGFALLVAGTVLVGSAIAVGNVLLPVVVRRDFARRPGPVLAASTTSLIVSAAIPSALTAPLALLMGWRAALAVWAVLIVVALAGWLAVIRLPGHRSAALPPAAAAAPSPPARSVWRKLAAWEVGVFFGLQALLFYATTAWLPTMLRDDGGLDAPTAGTALSVFQLVGIVGAIVVPMLATRQRVRYGTVVTLALMWVALFAGLLVMPSAWPLWCSLGGIAQGGCLAMGYTLIAVRTAGPEATRHVSAMVQTVGYCLGALGPVLAGGIAGAVAGWTAPFGVLIALGLACGVVGVRAASTHLIA